MEAGAAFTFNLTETLRRALTSVVRAENFAVWKLQEEAETPDALRKSNSVTSQKKVLQLLSCSSAKFRSLSSQLSRNRSLNLRWKTGRVLTAGVSNIKIDDDSMNF